MVTITGMGFESGATVTIGGAPATNVVVNGATSISAVAPARPAGPASIVVSAGGRQDTLTGGFTFVQPTTGPNTPPTVSAISAVGPRPNQPAGMADIGESLAVGVTVTDPETMPSALTYVWEATAGAFSGNGSTTSWTAPAQLPTPPTSITITVTLTVIEPYIVFSPQGQPMPGEHRITRTSVIRVHDSANEVRQLARQFLLDFSDSAIAPGVVVQNFSNTCGGKASELSDVEKNRCNYTITAFNVGDGTPVVNFGGTCVLQDRVRGADACIVIPVRWESTAKPGALSCPISEGVPPGTMTVAEGLDQVTAVYEAGSWRLCHSDFVSPNPLAAKFKK